MSRPPTPTDDFDDEEPTTEVVDVPMAEMVRTKPDAPTVARTRTRTYPPYRGRVVVGVR